MAKMSLSDLLTTINIQCTSCKMIKGISEDSRYVKEDELFLCFDLKYLQEAKKKGAITLSETRFSDYTCDDLNQAKQILIKTFYNLDLTKIKVIAVCGSNGKSSVASMLYQILKANNKCMLIGTHFIEFHGERIESPHTTPQRLMLTHLVDEAITLNYDYVIMEVSSHAIDQKRIQDLKFDVIIYTNILQDHLDYHKTRLHYRYSKYKLRHYLKDDGIIIVDSKQNYYQELSLLTKRLLLIDDKYEMIECNLKGSRFKYQNDIYMINVIGDYQINNALLVIQACLYLNINKEIIKEILNQYKGVKGRLQCVYDQEFKVFIDYAHTQDALKHVLSFLRSQCSGKMYCVVGCGGNRDISKRKVMGSVACMYSDLALFTSDNPRSEDIMKIIDDMCDMEYHNYKIFKNRYNAIKYSIQIASKNDIIVVVGKGDENTQEIMGKTYFCHDESSVKYFLNMKEDLKWKS